MKISFAIENYTNGKRITLADVAGEVRELLVEMLRLNKAGMREEWKDVGVFFQCWLYWRWKIDGEHWRYTEESWQKFMERIAVWQNLYSFVGLDRNISRFCGNYHRKEKVIRQLGIFGINEQKALEAYNKIVLKV